MAYPPDPVEIRIPGPKPRDHRQRPDLEAPLAVWEYAFALEHRVDALLAIIEQQADRIAWLEGDVAGWRIKLAECQAENQQTRPCDCAECMTSDGLGTIASASAAACPESGNASHSEGQR